MDLQRVFLIAEGGKYDKFEYTIPEPPSDCVYRKGLRFHI